MYGYCTTWVIRLGKRGKPLDHTPENKYKLKQSLNDSLWCISWSLSQISAANSNSVWTHCNSIMCNLISAIASVFFQSHAVCAWTFNMGQVTSLLTIPHKSFQINCIFIKYDHV